jgi:hypothetical protein
MCAFERQVMGMVRWLGRRCGRPARTRLIAELLGRPVRTVRWWLRRMEQQGMVCRPAGPKSGWAAAGR